MITEISQRGRRGLHWGEAVRGAMSSMAGSAAAGNKVTWCSQAGCRTLCVWLVIASNPASFPSCPDDYGQVPHLPVLQEKCYLSLEAV